MRPVVPSVKQKPRYSGGYSVLNNPRHSAHLPASGPPAAAAARPQGPQQGLHEEAHAAGRQ